jgi:hypothetical protein
MGANGGKLAYGNMDNLIKKYQSNGFKAVNRQNLYYRLEKMKKKGMNDDIIGKKLSLSDTTAVVLDLSGDTYHDHSITLVILAQLRTILVVKKREQ